jgi:hypothetical protein
VSYFRAQGCGVAVPNYPACHLDDARRRDNGRYVETTGGCHDAGDLRKRLHNTLYGGFGLLLEEMPWYFLKMQDCGSRKIHKPGESTTSTLIFNLLRQQR